MTRFRGYRGASPQDLVVGRENPLRRFLRDLVAGEPRLNVVATVWGTLEAEGLATNQSHGLRFHLPKVGR